MVILAAASRPLAPGPWIFRRPRCSPPYSKGWRRRGSILGSVPMFTEQELKERLRKITALFEGATTLGERSAAAAAIERVKKTLAAMARTEAPVEMQFTLSDQWHRR